MPITVLLYRGNYNFNQYIVYCAFHIIKYSNIRFPHVERDCAAVQQKHWLVAWSRKKEKSKIASVEISQTKDVSIHLLLKIVNTLGES